jgi:succinoglycan biosynthesis transport protein ExoP
MNENKNPLPSGVAPAVPDGESSDDFIDIDRLLSTALRHWRVIALGAALGLGLGILYLLSANPIYTSGTRILLDPDLGRFAEETGTRPPVQMDSVVLNQVEILKSSRLARTVVLAEKLDENEAFLNPPTSPIDWLKGQVKAIADLFSTGPELSQSNIQNARIGKAIAFLQRSLQAERVGRSSVIDVSFSATSPQLAGSITRAYAKAYLADQLDANFDATQQATVWLQDRLGDLRVSSQNAALEVEKYRAEQGLTSAGGELISERQLSDLNGQLILAQAETAKSLARYEQYKSIVDSGVDNAVQNATISNAEQPGTATIVDLKQRYLTVTKREKDIAAQFGADHPQAVSLRREEQDLTRQIFNELQQLTDSYRNEYEVAKSREDSLRANLSQLARESSATGNSLVRLRELEQQALALSTLYQTFLSRYEEASQQSSFPIAKARVISEAGNPVQPSSPKRAMALGLALVLGLFVGGAAAALQEFRERFFRTSEDVTSALGLKFLGHLPLLGTSAAAKPRRFGLGRKPAVGEAPLALPVPDGALVPAGMRYAVDMPASSFAETLRNAKIAADISLPGSGCKVIGFVSVLPHEGKTTAAANFAALLAANGLRTLLVDADLRNPGLSRRLLRKSDKGLINGIVGEVPWQNTVIYEPALGLSIIPSFVRGYLSHTNALLSGPGIRQLLQEAKQLFDYIIVDLPPLGPVVDAKAFEPMADGFFMVAEWGVTPRALVRSTLRTDTGIANKVLGVMLNKTDMRLLRRYGSEGASDRYIQRYASYYVDDRPAL